MQNKTKYFIDEKTGASITGVGFVEPENLIEVDEEKYHAFRIEVSKQKFEKRKAKIETKEQIKK